MSTLSQIKNMGAVNKEMTTRTLSPSGYRGGSDMWFFGSDGKDYKFTFSGHASSLTAYQSCPPLTAIINRKAQAHVNGRTFIMNVSGKGKGKESTSEIARKIRKLMNRPNPVESGKQFRARLKVYKQLYGWCIVLPIMPVGFENRGPADAQNLWILPPELLDVEENKMLFSQSSANGMIKSIKLRLGDETKELPLDKIYIFKDFTPSINSFIFPESRVKSLTMPINNIMASYESRNELICYAGSQGIISPDAGSGQYVAVPLQPDQKQQIQNDFRAQYGIRRGMARYIISPAPIKWQAMGVKTKDLALLEEVIDSTKALCDGYGYPPHLLGIIDPTFNNQNAAEKGFYQNTIIPEAESEDEEWDNFFKLEENEENIRFQTDFSHLPILQEDEKSKAEARKIRNEALDIEFKNNMITLNRWLELNGEDARSDEFGGKYYYELVAAGWKFGSGNGSTPSNNQDNQQATVSGNNNPNQNNNTEQEDEE